MLLATTADQKYWKNEKEIIFLGEWCKLYDKKDVWSELNYKTLPYHWDDRARFYQDCDYIKNIYAEYLDHLYQRLNVIHNTNHSHRYWRIIIGWWLRVFIGVVYDRYYMLLLAAKDSNLTHTYIPPKNDNVALIYPKRIASLSTSDTYNQQIYGRIIEYSKNIPFSIISENKHSFIRSQVLNKISIRESLKRFIYKLTPCKYCNVFFYNSYIKLQQQRKLKLALHQMPMSCLYPSVIIPNHKVNYNSRDELCKNLPLKSSFEYILNLLIKDFFPTIFLEQYEYFSKKALSLFPQKIKVILFATSSDTFNYWLAHCKERGATSISLQHGGHYGAGLLNTNEDELISTNDYFFSQGWDSSNQKKVKPLPAIQHLEKKRSFKYDKEGNILSAMMSLPRYSYWNYSLPIGPQFQNYIDQQFKFAYSLSSEARELLLLRLYGNDYGWGEKKRWRDFKKNIRIYEGKESLIQQLNHCRLFICTYNATTLLEALYINIPTIIFWNPRHWELRDSAKVYYDKLFDAGILHFSPADAAAKVNEVFQNPMEWWQQPEIQTAKNFFCNRFANSDSNWLTLWKNEISDLLT